MRRFILAIDQGTTSSRALIFNSDRQVVASGQKEFRQYYPAPGWVEHDPEEIWSATTSSVRTALLKAKLEPADIASIGIANQRETVVIWDKQTGKPIHNAIVWQDRRTASLCENLRRQGLEAKFKRKTGLLLDPYFSGTKIAWLLDNVSGARRRASRGELLVGTIDSFLIWRLTEGAVHATDATNASRTLLFNIAKNDWDGELLDILRVPASLLPQVRDCSDDYGVTSHRLIGAKIPIHGVAGDQQAAMLGQACFQPGMMKATYGTGCFALLNTGTRRVRSRNRLLTTIAYRLDGKTTYALEGSIFIAGASVQWLRDELKLIGSAAECEVLAERADPLQGVYLVPAFVGMGAPYWKPDARGAVFGLTRGSGAPELARAALESVTFQTHDLLAAMKADWKECGRRTILRVDGGMVASDWTMQRLADILNTPVDRPALLETTALGAAWLAGSYIGLWPQARKFADAWSADRRFRPQMDGVARKGLLAGWVDAVRRTLRD